MRVRRMLGTALSGTLVAVISLTTPGITVVQSAAAADPVISSVWTLDSYHQVFADDVAPPDAAQSIAMVAARNEYESGQIMVRKTKAFTISQVRFTDLRGAAGVLKASNLDYRFQEFEHIKANSTFAGSQPVTNPVRKAPGEFPDALSNDPTVDVPANSTQPIRVRAFVPKNTKPGSYAGTATVVTSRGNHTVPITLTVANVTIPDAADSSFTTDLWSILYKALSWDEGYGDTIELFYGYKPLTPKWWQLMGEYAKSMKENRHNNLPINVVQLVIGGGTTVDAQGKYQFNWSLFDKWVSFFRDKGVVKSLEGFWMGGPNVKGDPYPQVEIIDRGTDGRAIRSYAHWDSDKTNNFVDQFVPALRDHLRGKGWDKQRWMHVGDEVGGAEFIKMHQGISKKYKQLWPDVRLSDATFDFTGAQAVAPNQDFLIPNELALSWHPDFYKQQQEAGKQVWLYNCNIPTFNYLNRFIDQPVWNQRQTMWFAYSRDLTGYLHWAFNNWQYKMDDQEVRGDGWITKPDKENNKFKYTIRLESMRDGLEDRELLEILGKKDPGLAKDFTAAVLSDSNRYSRDSEYLARIRTLLVHAAAGETVPSLAAKQTRAGDGSLQLDLGKQNQVDAVRLRWSEGATPAYKLETSYDGEHWATAFDRTKGDGSEDLAGLDAKARYVRLSIAEGLKGIEVYGLALARENLAGGKGYGKPKPVDGYPDSGDRESTDGLLAGHYDDKRSYAYDVTPGTTQTYDVTVDLGSVQPADQVKVHRYEEYETAWYASDAITVATSEDGKAYKQKAQLTKPNGNDGVWHDARFPVTKARYLKVTFSKKHSSTSDMLFLDEIEAYGPGTASQLTNIAEGKPYAKSAAPDDPFYADAGTESTDGVIGGAMTDGNSYAYYLGPGERRTVDVTIDLQGPKSVNQVRIRKYDDFFHKYEPDLVTVYVKPVGGEFRPAGTLAWPTAGWYDVSFPDTDVTQIKVELTKSEGRFADYLFLDEIAVIGDLSKSPVNLVAGKAYTATKELLDPSYPDSTGRESTDGVLAGHYSDGKSWAYYMPTPQTTTAEIGFDLGARRDLSLARFREYYDGSHNYHPDKVTVLVSDDGQNYTDKGTVTAASSHWFEVVLSGTSARYVKFRAEKTYGYFAEYIFVDELEVYGR